MEAVSNSPVISDDDIPDWAHFAVGLTEHPVIRDDQGVLRYQASRIHRWLCDHIDLNEMAVAYQHGAFSRDEFMQFYRDIGYSLSGFEEVWAEVLDMLQEEGS